MQSSTAPPLVIAIVLGVVSFHALPVSGHGRLWTPAGRSTMWRQGFATPFNYDDNQLFCGGFAHQMSLGGKCGICGDPYDGVRQHEAGGKFARGVIAKTYHQGQDAIFQVDLTANHKGFFEFRICPTNSPSIRATKDCLDQNLLVVDNNGGTRHPIDFIGPAMVNVTVRFPASLTCDFCVVQWRYHAGNNWGTDPDGTSCLGCGPQEEFYGCADVRILGGGSSTGSTVTSRATGQSASTSTTTTSSTTPRRSTTSAGSSTTTTTTTASSSTTTTTSAPSPTTRTTTTTASTTTTTPDAGNCRSRSRRPALSRWCANNCQRGFCPGHLCTCNSQTTLVCRAIGAFTGNARMDTWCLNNCGMGFCPRNFCSCRNVPV